MDPENTPSAGLPQLPRLQDRIPRGRNVERAERRRRLHR